MTIVKELNELAKKITGTNPKANTDAQVMNYIEQNYSGGGVQYYDIEISYDFMTRYAESMSTHQSIEVTNEEDLEMIHNYENAYNENNNIIIRMNFMNSISYPNSIGFTPDNNIQTIFFLTGSIDGLVGIQINMGDSNKYYVRLEQYNLSSLIGN